MHTYEEKMKSYEEKMRIYEEKLSRLYQPNEEFCPNSCQGEDSFLCKHF